MENIIREIVSSLRINNEVTSLQKKDCVTFSEIRRGEMQMFFYRPTENINKKMTANLMHYTDFSLKERELEKSHNIMNVISNITELGFKQFKNELTKHVYIMT